MTKQQQQPHLTRVLSSTALEHPQLLNPDRGWGEGTSPKSLTSHHEQKDAEAQDVVRPLYGELRGAGLHPQTLDLQGMQQQGQEGTSPCGITGRLPWSPPAPAPAFQHLREAPFSCPGPFCFQNQQPSPHTPVSPSFLTLCKARVPCLSETPFPGTLCACALGRLQMGPGCDAPTVSVPRPPSDGSFPGQGLGQPIKVRRF